MSRDEIELKFHPSMLIFMYNLTGWIVTYECHTATNHNIQDQETTHDKKLTELLDMADTMNKTTTSNEGSWDLPIDLSDASKQPTTTPVLTGGKSLKSRRRATTKQVTEKILFSDLEKLHRTDEKVSEKISYNPELSDIRGKPLSH